MPHHSNCPCNTCADGQRYAEQRQEIELSQIDEDSYLSECCLLSVSKAKNGSFTCECGKFCRVDEDATVEQFLKYATNH